MVHAGNQSVGKCVRREQDRPSFFVGDRECADDRDDSVPCALGLGTRAKRREKEIVKV